MEGTRQTVGSPLPPLASHPQPGAQRAARPVGAAPRGPELQVGAIYLSEKPCQEANYSKFGKADPGAGREGGRGAPPGREPLSSQPSLATGFQSRLGVFSEQTSRSHLKARRLQLKGSRAGKWIRALTPRLTLWVRTDLKGSKALLRGARDASPPQEEGAVGGPLTGAKQGIGEEMWGLPRRGQ